MDGPLKRGGRIIHCMQMQYTVDWEIFASKNFRVKLNFALVYFRRFSKCGSAAFCLTFLLFDVEKKKISLS